MNPYILAAERWPKPSSSSFSSSSSPPPQPPSTDLARPLGWQTSAFRRARRLTGNWLIFELVGQTFLTLALLTFYLASFYLRPLSLSLLNTLASFRSFSSLYLSPASPSQRSSPGSSRITTNNRPQPTVLAGRSYLASSLAR